MDYARSIPLHGNPARALEAVRDYLIGHHFEIHESTASTIQARKFTNLGHQHSTSAFAEITARVDGNTLLINAHPRRLNRAIRGLMMIGAIFLIVSLACSSIPFFLYRGQLDAPSMFIYSRVTFAFGALSLMGTWYGLRSIERQAFDSFSNDAGKLCC